MISKERSFASRVFLLGERGSGTAPRNRIQDFGRLREKCLKSGKLFEDPEFGGESSLPKDSMRKKIEWKRPGDLAKDPKLFIDGASRFDVIQGSIGNCWFVSAMAELPSRPNLLKQVVPTDQSFTKDYAGIFHFRFWQYGKWIDVVVDDRLPTIKGRLIYASSNERNEFWSALLEKAYAKLYGGYDKLDGGKANEAMEDLTGGLGEHYILKSPSPPKNLFSIMFNASKRNSLMASQVEDNSVNVKAGFIPNHAYSITKIININVPNKSRKVGLLRLRNPWGAGREWNGPWSDQSSEWKAIPTKVKKEIGLTNSQDGEFWMAFEDFFRLTSIVSLCHLHPESMVENTEDPEAKKWDVYVFDGKWVKGVTAGGRRGEQTFHLNPQYRIKVQADDDSEEGNECSVVVGLMQKMKRSANVPTNIIGFEMFLIENPDTAPKPLDLNYFKKYRSNRLGKPTYTTEREIWNRVNLPTGVYCIIPTTVEPHQEGEFHLRVFSERKSDVEIHDVEVSYRSTDIRIVDSEPLSQEEKHAQDAKNFEIFTKVAGEDKEISWQELQALLNISMKEVVKSEGFSKEVCRSMIAMLDPDYSGKLNFNEFKVLWTSIMKWKKVFKLYDKNHTGELSAFEFRDALSSAGYKVNHQILNTLVQRYGSRDNSIAFDDFIMCAVKLKVMINFFKERDPDNTKKAMFTLDEWTERTLYS